MALRSLRGDCQRWAGQRSKNVVSIAENGDQKRLKEEKVLEKWLAGFRFNSLTSFGLA
jgi:hypothetical protein